MREPVQISCQDVEELLPLIAEGLIDPDSDAEVFEHLADCEACQEQLHQHDELTLALGQGRMFDTQTRRADVIHFKLPRSLAAAAAAILLACIGLLGAYSSGVLHGTEHADPSESMLSLEQPETQILEVLPPQPGDDVPMIIIRHNDRTMIMRQDQIDSGSSSEHLDAHVPVKIRY